jgi:hypothetical protein
MKKLGAILFGIVFILGLSIVTAPAQQVETVDPDGVVSFLGGWDLGAPVVEDFNDWGTNPDEDFASVFEQGNVTVAFDLTSLPEGPFTAIKVKLRAGSVEESRLRVAIYAGGALIFDPADDWFLSVSGSFTEYSYEWPGLNKTKEQLAGLEVEIAITDTWGEQMDISAIQVELVSEVVAPPEEPDPIQVNIDYRPYRSSNSLNYRSRGKVYVVIFGSADFDVSEIDRESLRLAGVAPVRDHIRRVYSRADRARDEYPDLVLKFKTKELIKALEIPLEKELENGDQVVLNLTGNLKDDTAKPIEGEDTAVVFGKPHKHKKKGKWKNSWKWWR